VVFNLPVRKFLEGSTELTGKKLLPGVVGEQEDRYSEVFIQVRAPGESGKRIAFASLRWKDKDFGITGVYFLRGENSSDRLPVNPGSKRKYPFGKVELYVTPGEVEIADPVGFLRI